MPAQNKLANETSPYLLQHAANPVEWYPWCNDAFDKARREDKAVFLSIGYSTCHWCHVMAHESFEDEDVAAILNEHFVSIKVDKEERPDIDSIYMSVCQAFTGSGGWPTSIFMTPEQIPFYAGTYFPKRARYGMPGFADLLLTVHGNWKNNREKLLEQGEKILKLLESEAAPKALRERSSRHIDGNHSSHTKLIDDAVLAFKRSFDSAHGGFGAAPKFPAPHNLLFLLKYSRAANDSFCLQMAEKTLTQMYRGGLFDHIGCGFSRYSTDKYFLAPHFEKMLYDNALLTSAYLSAFEITQNPSYKAIAVKTMQYVSRETTSPDGGFYCAQDADSDGVEGKYYVFAPEEITEVLGREEGKRWNAAYDVTNEGNFEGKSIPNLLKTAELFPDFDMAPLYDYRLERTKLHLDDKILCSWNALMISAFASAYRILGEKKYLDKAEKACKFIDARMSNGDVLYASCRKGKLSGEGFLDDYAFYIYALLDLYEATQNLTYADRAVALAYRVIENFCDAENGGFYLYGKDAQQLIIRPKETYDGAIPSGNSVMAYNLLKLSRLTGDEDLAKLTEEQMSFMAARAEEYPTGHSFYLLALMEYLSPKKRVVCDEFACKEVWV